ncbi:UPF0538 protein C2orf76 homolog [Strongylocentrotus purpuratus]|uniref:Uncharacterized protein n=1 Tax=Strongylocentrotus purpuratus TaxID=7668 RepID=A0A7M7P5D0_STRPU|nr:UPF0538 protein C2orf76 homolog [Strongylocentrotus purpuratus]|eukprot:XP_784271.1 PREDICTED: UPF0538 protein C2orf76 homolog [Strongylocentrotus purpuratus]
MEGSSEVLVTIRLIRSFLHRNIKHIVLHNVNLDDTVEELMNKIKEDIKTRSGLPPPFRKHGYDTLKVEYKKHGSKTSDPVINKEDDDKLMLKPDQTLKACNIENETEISFFNRKEYEQYKTDSTVVW